MEDYFVYGTEHAWLQKAVTTRQRLTAPPFKVQSSE
jgi:hypothetical protein